jgi:four helix bundle protein
MTNAVKLPWRIGRSQGISDFKSKISDFRIIQIYKMATIKSFEDLEVWKKSRVFAHAIYELSSEGSFAKDFKLRDQINGSAGSIMDNIAEGFDDFSSKEFLKFLGYSLRSGSEVQSQLYRALDCKYIDQGQFDKVYGIAADCRVQIRSFMKYLRMRK